MSGDSTNEWKRYLFAGSSGFGVMLRAAMNDSGAFPDVAIKMVEVGEQTGALQEMLNSLADFYDEEIETEVGRFITPYGINLSLGPDGFTWVFDTAGSTSSVGAPADLNDRVNQAFVESIRAGGDEFALLDDVFDVLRAAFGQFGNVNETILARKHFHEGAEGGDDLIEDQEDAVPAADLAQELEIALGRHQYAGRAGHRLDDDCGDRAGIVQRTQPLELVGEFRTVRRLSL